MASSTEGCWTKGEWAIWKRQTPEFVAWMQIAEFQVRASLDRFEGGKWFISLDVPPEIVVTPDSSLSGTYWEAVPVHITLGDPPEGACLEQLRGLVDGWHTVRLRKWSPRRESTTYRPLGTLADACEVFRQKGFSPRGEWHVSL